MTVAAANRNDRSSLDIVSLPERTLSFRLNDKIKPALSLVGGKAARRISCEDHEHPVSIVGFSTSETRRCSLKRRDIVDAKNGPPSRQQHQTTVRAAHRKERQLHPTYLRSQAILAGQRASQHIQAPPPGDA
jgi:hypothetical protein